MLEIIQFYIPVQLFVGFIVFHMSNENVAGLGKNGKRGNGAGNREHSLLGAAGHDAACSVGRNQTQVTEQNIIY